MKNRRRTIAILSDSFLGEYQTLIRASVEAFAQQQDANLQFIVGRELDSPLFSHKVQNGIFDQVDPRRVDGLLILAGSLSNYCGNEEMADFCRQYRNIPMCSIGTKIDGVPSIIMQNQSFSQLVSHLITHHQKKRFAFLAGPASNDEARARRAAFISTLNAHSLVFDHDLEACGDFLMHKGFEATNEIISRDLPFDALVAANDDMAVGALSALKQRGIRIPEEVVVTGFDDLGESRFVTPKLTTMRQPFEEVGDLAVNLLLSQMNNEPVPLVTELSPRLVVRQSCGCSPPSVQTTISIFPESEVPSHTSQKLQLEAVLLTQIKLAGKAFAGWETVLVDGLFEELDGTPNAFCEAISAVLKTSTLSAWVIDELNLAITYLRSSLVVSPDDIVKAENVWHRARTLLFDTLARRHVEDRLALLRTNKILVMRSVGNSLPHFSRNKLIREIIQELLTVGVQNAVVSIFTDDSCEMLECVVAVKDSRQVIDADVTYHASQLIPDFMQADTRQTYVIFPLANGRERLGILALEGGTASSYYEMLSEYLSTNIKLITLYQDQQRQLRSAASERQKAVELQHRQKLESLGVLAGGIAHDFNNMLSVMAGNLDVIHMEMAEDDPSMEPLQECRSTVGRATGLVQQLLAYSGKSKFLVRRTNLNQVVEELADFLKMAVSKSVEIKFNLASHLPDIEADTAQLHQIFVNLVINASDAIEEHGHSGTISIETETRFLDKSYFKDTISKEALPPGGYVMTRVSDTGVGIDPKVLKQIFDPFYTTKFGGRGLGLAAVTGIIRGHRGCLSVNSRKGKGTVFELAFPHLPTGSEQPRSPIARRSQIGAGTILIVDDEKAVLKAGARLLQRIGFSTLEAQNGQQAIDLVEDVPDVISCVIMDITMPGIGGVAAMAEIQKINPKIPVVLTSGYTEDSAIENQPGVRPAAFLQKPYNLETLSELMQHVLDPKKKKKKQDGL